MSIDIEKLSIQDAPLRKKRLEQLRKHNKRNSGAFKFHSRLVRFFRLFLPLLALGIVAILISWPNMSEKIEPLAKQAVLPQTIGKNELIKPRFESEDKNRQPFTITAKRAIQSAKDPEVIFLETPAADITMSDGAWVAVQAQRGAYRQNDERLLLEEKVKLFHDAGYNVETEKLMMNLKTQKAWTETPLHLQGPAGILDATGGMQAENASGLLIFNGPVKLVLNKKIKGL